MNGAAAVWIESSFTVAGRQIGISVKRIDETEAGRLAAVFAWFGTPPLAASSGEDSEWPATLQHIFRHYIALTMDEPIVEDLPVTAFTTALCAAALQVFIRINGMKPAIAQQLCQQRSPGDVAGRGMH